MYTYILVSVKEDGLVQAWESWEEKMPEPGELALELPARASEQDAEDILDGEMVQFSDGLYQMIEIYVGS